VAEQISRQHITLVTRAVTSLDMDSLQTHTGLNTFIARYKYDLRSSQIRLYRRLPERGGPAECAPCLNTRGL
jgi:hypothetical protein